MPPKAPKASITCNWMRSNVTNETLANFVKSGYFPKKEIMSYRAPIQAKKDLNQRMVRSLFSLTT